MERRCEQAAKIKLEKAVKVIEITEKTSLSLFLKRLDKEQEAFSECILYTTFMLHSFTKYVIYGGS
jgi:hypothetical protein